MLGKPNNKGRMGGGGGGGRGGGGGGWNTREERDVLSLGIKKRNGRGDKINK